MTKSKSLLAGIGSGMILGVITGLVMTHSVIKKPIDSTDLKITQKKPQTLPTETPTPTPSDFCVDVPILFYHHIQPLEKAAELGEQTLSVSPENFEWHIQYLVEKGYTIISLQNFVEDLINRKNIEKSVVITLDDGYKDNYFYAYPIAKKYNIPLTIAIPSWYIDRFEGHLSWKEINEMYHSGNISFVIHSFSHRSLAISDEKVFQQQILEAQKALENSLGELPNIVIYPYGRYNDHVIKYLKKNNFLAAFSTEKGTKHCISQIYNLPRLRMGNAGPRAYGL